MATAVLVAGFAALLLDPTSPCDAFHRGGTGSCRGCHVTHGSEGGDVIDPGQPLLRGETATDVCLSCHALEYGAVLGTDPLNPPPERGGGNFVHLLEDNLNDAPGGAVNPISGNHAGHNVVSTTWGIPADPDLPTAPGGIYPSAQLGCTSCHDPHGNANYRMLHGVGSVGGGVFQFVYPAPQGDGLATEGGGTETPVAHSAYNGSWTDWCMNCHEDVHTRGPGFHHPVDRAMEDLATAYAQYNGSDDPVGGDHSTAYLPEVPIEDPAVTTSSTFGAGSSSRVTCMSCHRAHATSAPAAGRWDFNVLHLSLDGAESGSWAIPSPYSSPVQRQLCVKCHWEYAQDHGLDRACMECHSRGPASSEPQGPSEPR